MKLEFRALSVLLAGVLVLLGVRSGGAALTPEVKCQAAKLATVSKYQACLLKAEIKGVLKNLVPDAAKCESRFVAKFNKIELKAGPGVCPSEMDLLPVGGAVVAHAQALAGALTSGGSLPVCGNGIQEASEQCDQFDLVGSTCGSLGFSPVAGTLGCSASCLLDTTGCVAGTLVPGTNPILPKTGQDSCYDSLGATVSCVGTGQDAEVQAGQPRTFTNNGNGTITDHATGLMWEVKCNGSSCPALNRIFATYTWEDAFTKHVAMLNSTNFGGHNDWRLPNLLELETVWDMDLKPHRTISHVFPVFDNCAAVCPIASCSCNFGGRYWSSSGLGSVPPFGVRAWTVDFVSGPDSRLTSETNAVRAVRGGL